MARAELIYFHGCPYILKAKAILRAAGIEFTDTAQDILAPDDPRRTYSSPTVILDGKLLFGRPNAAFECTMEWAELEQALAPLSKTRAEA